jgi:hypothetical protein
MSQINGAEPVKATVRQQHHTLTTYDNKTITIQTRSYGCEAGYGRTALRNAGEIISVSVLRWRPV